MVLGSAQDLPCENTAEDPVACGTGDTAPMGTMLASECVHTMFINPSAICCRHACTSLLSQCSNLPGAAKLVVQLNVLIVPPTERQHLTIYTT